MRMRYRGLVCVFAMLTLYFSTQSETQLLDQTLPNINDITELNKRLIARKGIISELAHVLEGISSITEDVLHVILLPVKQLIKLDQEAILENAHKGEVATVRIGSPICEQEKVFRAKRFPIVKKAQENFLGMKLRDQDVLDIAFVGSGGGVRAKTYSLGSWVAADEIGLLDTVMCMSGLSGTTWFLAPWMSSGLPLSEYKDRAIRDIVAGVNIKSISDLGPIFDALWVKFAYSQHLNIIDLYGGIIGNNCLRDFGKPQNMVYLSEQQNSLTDAIFPFPVYSATLGNADMPNYWFEFTPFEVGSRWLSAYIPTWSFGRKFKKGKSCSDAPEQPLGFMIGTFGSAFAASFEELYDRSLKAMEMPKFLEGVPAANKIFEALKKLLSKIACETDLGEFRAAWAQVFNYVYKMKECPFSKEQDLKLIDAGIDFNNPIFGAYRKPPFGEAPDVIFVFDSGATVDIEELERAERYAIRNNLKFPKIDKKDITERTLTVYGHGFDPSIPLVIYMPRISDQKLIMKYLNHPRLGVYANKLKGFDMNDAVANGFAGTFNFDYTKEEAELVCDLAKFNLLSAVDEIKDLLKTRIAVKKDFS